MKAIQITILLSLIHCVCNADRQIPDRYNFKAKGYGENYWNEKKNSRELNTKLCPVNTKIKPYYLNTTKKKSKIICSKPYEKTPVIYNSKSKAKIAEISTSSMIEIAANTVINTNTIWDANVVYINGKVYIEGAYLWIMPGVTVLFNGDGGLIVRNNGVIKVLGSQNNNSITFDTAGLGNPDDYDFAIKIEETASPLCEISFCRIFCAEKGIWIQNKRLETEIKNSLLCFCYDGIWQEGPELTDIINCEFVDCFDDGVEVYLGSFSDPTIASNKTCIALEHLTITGSAYGGWGQNCGISVHGVPEQGKAGTVLWADIAIANSYYCAVNQVDGWMVDADRYCFGYYENAEIENYGNPYDDIMPKIPTEDPFLNGYHGYPLLLKQNSNFVNGGCMHISQAPYLLAKTTSSDGSPDVNIADIGYHYINWNFVNAGSSLLDADFDNNYSVDIEDVARFASYWLFDYREEFEIWQWDLDDNGVVDLGDLQILSEYWLNPATFYDFAIFSQYWQQIVDSRLFNSRYDLDNSGTVDFTDFSIFANQWQSTTEPTPANIEPTFNQDSNDINGYVEMYINSVVDPNVYRAFALIDGEFFSEFSNCHESPKIGIKSQNLANGSHSIKIVVLYNDMIICSQPREVVFNNEMVIVGSERFVPGEDYIFYSSGSGIYQVQLKDRINEQTIFSQVFENNINCVIDACDFPESWGVYELDIQRQISTLSTEINKTDAINYEEIIRRVISRRFRMEDFNPDDPNSPRPKAVISIGSEELEVDKEQCWLACVRACVYKGIYPVLLRYGDCSWNNLRFCILHPAVKIWYHVAHGNYQLLFQPVRQCVQSADGWIFSYLDRNLDQGNLPPDYERMSWYYENNPSLADLGLWESSKMIWVQFNCCYSGHTPQFPNVLGMLRGGWPGDPIGSQIFIGWKDSALVYDIVGRYNEFEETYYWPLLRQGYNLKDAVEDGTSSIPVAGLRIRNNFIYYGVVDWQYAWFRYPNIN